MGPCFSWRESVPFVLESAMKIAVIGVQFLLLLTVLERQYSGEK